jgi:hypothetical protein
MISNLLHYFWDQDHIHSPCTPVVHHGPQILLVCLYFLLDNLIPITLPITFFVGPWKHSVIDLCYKRTSCKPKNYQTDTKLVTKKIFALSPSDQMARLGDMPVPALQAILLLGCILPLLMLRPCCAQQAPSPGYYPSSMYRSVAFSEDYRTLWGSQHQTLSPDGKSLTLWMDSSSGDRSICSFELSDYEGH